MAKIIIGNFKMNKTIKECREYAIRFSGYKLPKNKNVIICPPYYVLEAFFNTLGKNCSVGAQNVSSEESGAMTGELSASMLKSAGVSYAIVGHSERRNKLSETDEDVNLKVKRLLAQGITPIICIGEKLDEISKKKSVLGSQLTKALKGVSGDYIVAYEPVWAIGTGKTCDVATINKTHEYIKEKIFKLTGKNAPVIYGGSVKSNNAKLILDSNLVDGVLVGGACLNVEEFYKIITA